MCILLGASYKSLATSGLSWLIFLLAPSVTACKIQENPLKWITAASFHIVSKSPFPVNLQFDFAQRILLASAARTLAEGLCLSPSNKAVTLLLNLTEKPVQLKKRRRTQNNT